MRMSPRLLLAALGAVLLFQAGCSSDATGCEGGNCLVPVARCGNTAKEAGEQCDDGNNVSGDGCSASCGTETVVPQARCGDGRVGGLEVCDDGNTTEGDGCSEDCSEAVTRCAAANAPALPDGATCAVTKAGNGARLFTGVVLKDGETLLGGQVLVDAQGIIQCSACDCASATGAAEATQVSCPTGVISPGLVNPHEHLTFPDKPHVAKDPEERYEHRNEWRRGRNEHTEIGNNGSKNAANILRYQELRHLLAGTTSIAGAGGTGGLVRNIDNSNVDFQHGLKEGYADSDTFPLGDIGGEILSTGCGYPSTPSSSQLPKVAAYLPHIAEGIDITASNEFRCLSAGNSDVLFARTAVIHGIGLTANEMALMAERGTGLVWSPRSNIALYGDTAMVPAFQRMGVSVALGTDWLQSGSMNVLRELQCADYLNATYYGKTLTDVQLWRMVTGTAADLTDVFEKVGRIAPGKVGDLAIFRLRTFADSPHRAVITANPEDVVLTVRGEKVLYGDGALVDALNGEETCDTLDVCGASKTLCLSELGAGVNLATLQGANSSAYPLFACGTPQNEPVCAPRRASTSTVWPASRNGSSVYTSEVSPDDTDGDGVANTTDNCPSMFNPVRPMDNGAQLDTDGDRVGDACDPCPLAANATSCEVPHPADDDGDNVATWRDNCPFLANPTQVDTDRDGKGDVCDGCPQQAEGTCENADPSDPDYDSVLTPGDNCAYVPNPQQADADGDGTGDACDTCAVANPDGAPCPTTVYDLKTPVNGKIALLGSTVALTNVLVTAVNATGTSGYFVQVHPPLEGKGVDHSAIYVFGPKADIAVGDRLDITEGTLTLYFGMLQLTDVKATKLSTGNALPDPVLVRSEEVRTGGPRATALDAVLLELRDVGITGAENSFDEFIVNENRSGDPATTGLKVDDQAFDYPERPVGTTFTTLRGVLTFSFNEHKLLPRSAADMVVPLPPLPALTAFAGGEFIRVGSTTHDTIPQVLTVTMASAYPVDVTVAVTSGAPEALTVVGGGVTIPAGQTSAVVKLNALAQAASVTLTATLGESSQTARVRVLGETEQPAVSRINPGTETVVPGGTVSFTVVLDVPAPENTTVALTMDPEGLGTFGVANGTLPVAKDATTATFTFTADPETASASGTLTARIGESSATTTLTVDQTSPRLASLVPASTDPVPAGGTLEFTVTLDRAAPQDTLVTLAATPGTGVTLYGTVPATVMVLSGQTSATFTFTADAQGGGAGTVSASLSGINRSVAVTVTPPPPALSTLTPGTATVYFTATQAFTVTLDRAAPAGGITVNVALEPATGVGTLSAATVSIAEGQTSGQVTFTAGEAAGRAALSATYDGVTRTAEITVTSQPTVNRVVISEISGGNGTGGTLSTDEFVELYNPTDSDITLNGWSFQYKSATNTERYTGTATIPDGTVIKARGYLLIAHTNYTGSVTADVTYSFDMSASTTAGGHVRIGPNLTATNLNDPNTVDKIGWGTANQPEGTKAPNHPAAGGSLERKARPESTSATMAVGGADENAGNGHDSNDNSVDFVTRAARQPQNSSSPTERP
ncbi:lamin tail domain-containing protein [Pyxidicoccus sp. 3LG]